MPSIWHEYGSIAANQILLQSGAACRLKMQLVGKTVIVTGGGSGIGRALCEAFQLARAKNIVVADVNLQAAERVAAKVGGIAFRCDVAKETDVRSLIERTESDSGPVDLYCSNAGVALGFAPRG